MKQLAVEFWDSSLGGNLGRNGGDYVEIISSLPKEVDSEVQKSFAEQWGKQDPEATLEWIESLLDDASAVAATAGLASAWIRYDGDAATAWAASRPAGLARDTAADNICYWLSMKDSKEAWYWADSIADPKIRASAYQQVAQYWRSKVPEAFRVALNKARRAVDQSSHDEPKEDENKRFK